MSFTNGIINAPVSIDDVKTAIGVTSGDLGSLCQSQKVNKFSKMKPVAFPFIEPDRTQPVSAYGKTLWWWKGHPTIEEVPAGLVFGNYTTTSKCVWITSCGIKFIGFSTKIDLLKAMDPANNRYHTGDDSPLANNFVYVPPAGGIDEPFRLVDFNYYLSTASYNVIPDYGTESGTQRIVAANPESSRVVCGIMCPQVSDTINSELSFNDLFKDVGSSVLFTVVTGIVSTNSISLVSLSTTTTKNDDAFKEVAVDLNSSQAWGKTVVAIYCAAISLGQDIYYVPLMQSTGDCPNTPINYAPRRRIYQSWYVDNSTPYYALTFTQKQNYGSSFPWQSVNSMSSFMTNGVMNRWYLKLEMPRKSSTYSFGNNSFKIEFTGQFMNNNGQVDLIYYALTSSDTRFVLKNNEVTNNYDWGTTETVTVTAGSGTQTCYLAIYDLFADRNAVVTTKGGIVWRVRLFFLNGQSSFSAEPDVVYGSLDNNHLTIDVPAVT